MFKKHSRAQEIKESMEALIGSIKQAPKWILDNDDIHRGYRIGFNTTCDILKSLFMLHNESVNVWSHLFGVILFLIFICYTAITLGPKLNAEFNLKIMDHFNTLYHMADNMTLCSDGHYCSLSEQIFKIYHEEIGQFDELECSPDSEFLIHSDHEVCLPNSIVTDLSNSEGTDLATLSMANFLDRAQQYVHSMAKGLKQMTMKVNCSESEVHVTKIPLYIHILSAIICLSCSTIYHLFFVHSESVSKILARLDYAGISFLIGGSGVPPIYYSLYCSDGDILRPIYLTITFLACLGAFTVTMMPKFDTPKYRPMRAILFVLLGVASAYPLIQFCFFRNPETMFEFPWHGWALGGAIYIFGAYVYSIRFPESWFPGKFDL